MTHRRNKVLQLTLRWVLGHEGVDGIEEADRLATKRVSTTIKQGEAATGAAPEGSSAEQGGKGELH
jgi:ribonuclease HI